MAKIKNVLEYISGSHNLGAAKLGTKGFTILLQYRVLCTCLIKIKADREPAALASAGSVRNIQLPISGHWPILCQPRRIEIKPVLDRP